MWDDRSDFTRGCITPVILHGVVPLEGGGGCAASQRNGNNSKRFKDFCLQRPVVQIRSLKKTISSHSEGWGSAGTLRLPERNEVGRCPEVLKALRLVYHST